MSHTVSTYTCLSNLNATLITYDTFILNLLILTAMTLPVFARSEYSFTEQTISFWL